MLKKNKKNIYRIKFSTHLWYLTIKNMKSMFRDKMQLLWIIGYPLMFMIIFFFAFGSTSSREIYKIAIINEDDDDILTPETSPFANASYIFTDILDSKDLEEFVDVVSDDDYNFKEAYNLLQVEEIDAILEIDDLFSECIYFLDQSPNIDITTVPDEVTEGVMKSLVSSIVDQISLNVNNLTVSDIDTEQIIDAVDLTTFDYMVPGFMIGNVLVIISQLSSHFAEEKEKKTLQRLSTTPVAKRNIVLSGLISQLIISAIQIFIMLFMAIGVFGAYVHPDTNLLVIFLLPLLFSFTALGIGLLLASFVKSSGSAAGLAWLIILPLQFLGGIWFPFENPLTSFIPTHYAAHAMSIAMTNGQSSWNAIGLDVLILAGVGLATTFLGIILFERKSAVI